MFWVQAAVCFGLWILYGIYQFRRAAVIRQRIDELERSSVVRIGILSMLGGAGVLFLAFIVCILGSGLSTKGFSWWAWILMGLGGLAFVHAQTISTAMLMTLADDSVTSRRAPASDLQNPDSAS